MRVKNFIVNITLAILACWLCSFIVHTLFNILNSIFKFQVFSNEEMLGALVSRAIVLIIFLAWYIKCEKHAEYIKEYYKAKPKEYVAPSIIIGINMGVIPLYVLITVGMMLFVIIGDDVNILRIISKDQYEKSVELIPYFEKLNTSIWGIIDSIIVAPILEELAFRGVAMKHMIKSKMPIYIIILLNGIFFGIFHGNIVQAFYASFAGAILAWIRYRYKDIKASMLAHMSSNFISAFPVEKLILNKYGGITVFGVCIIRIMIVLYTMDFINKQLKNGEGILNG